MTMQYTHIETGRREATCDKHGSFEAIQWSLDPLPASRSGQLAQFLAPFWSACPICDQAAQAEADARAAEIQGGMTAAKAMAAQRLRSAGIAPRYAEATIWNWQHPMDQQRRVWNWVRDYASSLDLALQTGRSGVMLGSPGTGKTHLACGLLRHVIEKGGTGCYVTVMSLLGRIKDTYRRDSHESESNAIEALCRYDMLVIDEIGKSIDNNHESAQFFRVLDTRYQNCKPTIMVTNLNQAGLVAFLGEAVVDRLRENGGGFLVFDWASQRNRRPPKDAGDA